MPTQSAELLYQDQGPLWKHMATRCSVPLVSREEYRNRKTNLKAILEQVNDGGYSPSKPHGFLSAPKQSSVARFIPVFTHTDTAVYFACLQAVDQKLASAAVPGTYGGWQLGGARRSIEEKEALEIFGWRRFTVDSALVLQPGRLGETVESILEVVGGSA